jgi:hypothetical protein
MIKGHHPVNSLPTPDLPVTYRAPQRHQPNIVLCRQSHQHSALAPIVDIQLVSGQVYPDPTGRFLTPSTSDNADMLILYDEDSNAILVESMKSQSSPQILAAYKRAIVLLTERNVKPRLQKLDSEA